MNVDHFPEIMGFPYLYVSFGGLVSLVCGCSMSNNVRWNYRKVHHGICNLRNPSLAMTSLLSTPPPEALVTPEIANPLLTTRLELVDVPGDWKKGPQFQRNDWPQTWGFKTCGFDFYQTLKILAGEFDPCYGILKQFKSQLSHVWTIEDDIPTTIWKWCLQDTHSWTCPIPGCLNTSK